MRPKILGLLSPRVGKHTPVFQYQDNLLNLPLIIVLNNILSVILRAKLGSASGLSPLKVSIRLELYLTIDPGEASPLFQDHLYSAKLYLLIEQLIDPFLLTTLL